MEGATFLTRVVLENYKSIAHCDVRLGPLNYLVGPNGAGKSNFLDALRFVADALTHSVQQALRNRGGGAAICHAPHKQQGYFRIHLEFLAPDEAVGHYTLKIGQVAGNTPSGVWEVLDEKIGLPTARGEVGAGLHAQYQTQRPFFGDHLALAHVADQPAYRAVYTALTQMLFYTIKPRNIQDVVNREPAPFLAPDGSNLASVFSRLALPPNAVAERINEYLRLILPGLSQVRVESVGFKDQSALPVDNQKVALLFEQLIAGAGVHLFWPSQMSEGTLRALGVLTALEQACVEQGPRPSLVAVEEPEDQVHPAVVGVLRDAMVEASYSTQVLVTTHSSDLLDNKDVKTECLLAVMAEKGVTHIGPLDKGARDLIRRRLYTPGELLRIGQVFPEDGKVNSPNAPASSLSSTCKARV